MNGVVTGSHSKWVAIAALVLLALGALVIGIAEVPWTRPSAPNDGGTERAAPAVAENAYTRAGNSNATASGEAVAAEVPLDTKLDSSATGDKSGDATGSEPRVNLLNSDFVMFFARVPSRIRAERIIRSRQFNPIGQDVEPDELKVLEGIVDSYRGRWSQFSDRYFDARRREVELAKTTKALLPLEEALASLPKETVERAEHKAIRTWQATHDGKTPAPGDEEWQLARQRSMARTIMPFVGKYSTVQIGKEITFARDVALASDDDSSKAVKLDPELVFWKTEFFYKVLAWAAARGLIDDGTANKHISRFHEFLDAHREFWQAR